MLVTDGLLHQEQPETPQKKTQTAVGVVQTSKDHQELAFETKHVASVLEGRRFDSEKPPSAVGDCLGLAVALLSKRTKAGALGRFYAERVEENESLGT